MTNRAAGRRRLHETLALAIAATLISTPVAALDAVREAQLTNLVRQDCGACHGMTLKGGLGSPLVPERFSDVASEGIAAIILNGIPGTPMPPWRGLLSEPEALWIAERLKAGMKP
jgi:cytochrome c55X